MRVEGRPPTLSTNSTLTRLAPLADLSQRERFDSRPLTVKCWDVPCPMSYVFVKLLIDQMTSTSIWSMGQLTDTYDIVHGTSQHLTSFGESHT